MSPSLLSDTLRAYWRRNLRLTGALLFVWFLVSFVAIVAAYAWCMHRLEQTHGLAEEP